MRFKIVLLIPALMVAETTFAQDDNVTLNPGVDRWEIKTSVAKNNKPKHIPLAILLNLPLLGREFSGKAIDKTIITEDLGGGLEEGDIVTTEGYLHLVALEDASKDNKDGDYHIQLTTSPEWGDSCFIVEIPYSEFITEAYKDSAINARNFIRDNLTNGQTPSVKGSVMQSTVFVKVTGQLFYDGIHAASMRNPDPTKNRYRGKSNKQTPAMHSYTGWEIHPVIHIEFAEEL